MALLNYGFNFYQTRKLYAANQPVLTLPVWKGAADEVQLGVPRDVYATIPRGQEGSLSAAADVAEPLHAPLQQGAEVGKLRVTLGGQTVGAYPLHPIARGRGSWFLRAHGRRCEALAGLDVREAHSMADPLPICYLNGEFLPLRDARISPLDRGFLFADSVYEVLPVFAGRMFRFREHFDRLARSLGEIGIPSPHAHAQWLTLLEELIRRNGGADMYVYVQVTRGMEFGRNHAFPATFSSGRIRNGLAAASPDAGATRERSGGHHRRGLSLGTLRHQDDRAARQRADEAAGR